MTLETELEAARARADPTYLVQIRDAAMQLDRTGMSGHARRAGEPAPEFALPAIDGTLIGLSDLLRSGPVAISFYRGEWCQFCRAELDALLAAQPTMAALGATLLLIAPEPASADLLAKVAALGDRVWLLQDRMLGVALRFGLVFLVPTALRRYYVSVDFDIARDFSTGSWLLPLPADFVVDVDGRIAMAWADADFTRRLDPLIIVEALGELKP